MPKSMSEDFEIHVDSSCLTDSTDLQKPCKRHNSEETVIHHKVDDMQSDHEGSQVGCQVSHDEHTEALIHATARAVVASIERDSYGQEDSILSARTDESYDGGNELTYGDGSELAYGSELEQNYESDPDHEAQDHQDGSASSHLEDDVFSLGNGRSNRSSLNSITDEDIQVTTSKQGEVQNREHRHVEDLHSLESHISRASSNTFSVIPEPLTVTSSPTSYTPSKVNPRPPFRTPSSIRAIQMSSPTPSVFGGSPRSSKRPTVSRLGTPQTQNQSPAKKTPTRFKAKKEPPLILLHVTVLTLHWPYATAMDALTGDGLPRELHSIRESWKLLQEKLRDTVLERGILLPHPQDSYEVLEERLLESLELPVRPRARILTCGHYMGPDDLSSEEESESEDGEIRQSIKEKWCDICGREVRYEEFSIGSKQKRFRVKVYASNGLMTAGSWAAVWREMERVDVEIVPLVHSHLVQLMDSLVISQAQSQVVQRQASPVERDDGRLPEERQEPGDEDEALLRRKMEEERLREVYGHEIPEHTSKPEDRGSRKPRSTRQQYGDSLPELIFAAIKVAMRDKRNILIAMLSVLVLGLSIRGRPAPEILFHKESILPAVERGSNYDQEALNLVQEIPNMVKEVPDIAREVPNTVREVPNIVKEVPNTTGEVQNVVNEVPNTAREVPNVINGAPNTAREIPNIVKEGPNMARENSNMEREPPNMAREAPNLAKETLSIDRHAARVGSNPVPEIPPNVAEPVELVPPEVLVSSLEHKVDEQPPPSASKETVFIPNDPCHKYKQQLALQGTLLGTPA